MEGTAAAPGRARARSGFPLRLLDAAHDAESDDQGGSSEHECERPVSLNRGPCRRDPTDGDSDEVQAASRIDTREQVAHQRVLHARWKALIARKRSFQTEEPRVRLPFTR
jgi:hypothetical protein